jgi:hypothetical protein
MSLSDLASLGAFVSGFAVLVSLTSVAPGAASREEPEGHHPAGTHRSSESFLTGKFVGARISRGTLEEHPFPNGIAGSGLPGPITEFILLIL